MTNLCRVTLCPSPSPIEKVVGLLCWVLELYPHFMEYDAILFYILCSEKLLLWLGEETTDVEEKPCSPE